MFNVSQDNVDSTRENRAGWVEFESEDICFSSAISMITITNYSFLDRIGASKVTHQLKIG